MRRKQTFDLDTPLFAFTSGENKTLFTIRHASEGISIMGGTGSGKTSGSGGFLARKLLSAGYGGLVLTVKPDEKDLWVEYCKKAKRSKDLLIVEPGGKNVFNFLDYEASKDKGMYTQNIVRLLKTVITNAEQKKSNGRSDDIFFEKAQDMLLFSVIELCLLAYGKLAVDELYSIVLTAPKKDEVKNPNDPPNSFEKAYLAARKNVLEKIDTWKYTLAPLEFELIQEDKAYYEKQIIEHVRDAARLMAVDQFFNETYRNLSEKTRSIVLFSFGAFLHSLLQDPIYSLFCRHASTFTPDDAYLNKKIILLNLPVKIYDDAGRDIQILFKYLFQRAVERRDLRKNTRPVFIWADECQYSVLSEDILFQTTARSSRICTVNLTQNLSNYYSMMGGEGHKSEQQVKALLGVLATKIFHANAHVETNFWASSLMGKGWTEDVTRGSHMAGEFSTSRNSSYKLEDMVRPEHFNLLKTGGPDYNYLVESYIHFQGRAFDNGLNFRKVTFKQNQK